MKVRQKGNNKNQYGKGQRIRKLMILSGYFLCMFFFVTGGFLVFRISGKYNLKKQTISYAMSRNAVQTSTLILDENNIQQDGDIRYKGQNYNYNDDMLTFLFMGIDEEGKAEASEEHAKGGQADALFLFVLNPHEEVIKLIPINSSTMTAIDVYDEQGVHEGTITAQISTQYGFGDGGKVSCEYQVEAVRKLFYGIPISGYLAVDMDSIPEVITLIDGIDPEVLEDVVGSGAGLSADSRLTRQTQLLTEFIGKVKGLTGKDFTIPVRMYHEIADGTVTNISADEVAYLATFAGDYYFDAGEVVMVPGKSVSGGESLSGCDEFYADEDGLYGMIVDVFYEPVG